ncbi:hypothetical protein [Nocardioides sp. B-3]|uniref:hypothetical protein n=1 Tax=Nocardioides sp. B-3 TaxID=2895565 RepID=UPI0021520B02|nr:hypothetical protein [Nocardioides sp. B-3]UUZ61025.1 hypothetical protein LP418_10345 [Nocardioides sp. B-3]
MSFVPVTGPATFRAGEPPRDGHVEFTDQRRTVALPIRGALPLLTKAHARDDLHPSVALLSGAALLGMRPVAAGKFGPDPSGLSWQVAALERADEDRITQLAAARAHDGLDAASAEGIVRAVLDAVADAMPRSAPIATRRPPIASGQASSRKPAVDPDFTRRLRGARRAPGPGRATTDLSSSRSPCGSRPTRRSWWPAPYASCSGSTPPRTPPTCATQPCCGPSRDPMPATASATARARMPASRCGRRPTPGRCSSASSSCGSPTS